jgi:hypothetical protein
MWDDEARKELKRLRIIKGPGASMCGMRSETRMSEAVRMRVVSGFMVDRREERDGRM